MGRKPTCECGECGVCKRRAIHNRWLSDPENRASVLERNRKWKRENKAIVNEFVAAYKVAYPEKRRAHSLLKKAIDAGRIERQPCEECGSVQDVHGHHDDYTKPYDVRWLCRMHHNALHKDMSNA